MALGDAPSAAAGQTGARASLPLPIPVKLAIIVGVIGVLVILKQLLKGFMAVFPMVGVVGSYEARQSPGPCVARSRSSS